MLRHISHCQNLKIGIYSTKQTVKPSAMKTGCVKEGSMEMSKLSWDVTGRGVRGFKTAKYLFLCIENIQ